MDRSNEHLGTTDRPIILMRKQLLKAVEDVRAGHDPLFVERDGDPNALQELIVRVSTVPATTDIRGDWWREQTAGTRGRAHEPAE